MLFISYRHPLWLGLFIILNIPLGALSAGGCHHRAATRSLGGSDRLFPQAIT